MYIADLIGDVHGQYDALQEMLNQLGYACDEGQWSHPEDRRLVFLGDLIDRGPKNRDVVHTVRQLVDQGIAICLMGNHEFNAVQYHTEHPADSGIFLRPHTEKNYKQHKAFLDDYAGHEEEMQEVIQWFSSLPVAIDTPSFRAVHACWSPKHLLNLRNEDGDWYMEDRPWPEAAQEGHAMFDSIETLLKGPEKELPNGLGYSDKNGHPRTAARLAWWQEHPEAWAEAIDASIKLPELEKLPWNGPFLNYPTDHKPVFFGHYWRTGDPSLDASNAFCLDYSAGKDGHLTAYRFDDNNPKLDIGCVIQIKV